MFNPGDRVICINSNNVYHVKKDNSYIVNSRFDDDIFIETGYDILLYKSFRFKLDTKYYRAQKIKKLREC